MNQPPLVLQQLELGFRKGKSIKRLTQPFTYAGSGRRIALMGLNGTGKSTLLKTLAGLSVPLAGSVQLEGSNLHQLSVQERARKVSMVFSQPPATGNFRVEELLAFGRTPYLSAFSFWKPDAAAQTLTEHFVALFRLENYLDRPFLELSDGEKQRVMMARAFIQDTPLMLLDEPTAHLDLVNKRKIYDLLRELHQHEPTKTLIFSSHEPELALSIATEVWLIHDGAFQVFSPASFRTDSPFAQWI